jgi:hypothetical protein
MFFLSVLIRVERSFHGLINPVINSSETQIPFPS